MTASIPWFQFAFHLFVNGNFICEGFFFLQIFELFHVFKEFMTCLYVVIFPLCWSRDMVIHSVISAFTSRTISNFSHLQNIRYISLNWIYSWILLTRSEYKSSWVSSAFTCTQTSFLAAKTNKVSVFFRYIQK